MGNDYFKTMKIRTSKAARSSLRTTVTMRSSWWLLTKRWPGGSGKGSPIGRRVNPVQLTETLVDHCWRG